MDAIQKLTKKLIKDLNQAWFINALGNFKNVILFYKYYNDDIKIDEENIKGVKEFGKLNHDGRKESKRRSLELLKLKWGLIQKQNLLWTSLINLENRKMLLWTCVWSFTLYDCKTWMIGEGERDRLEGYEIWCYKRIL